MSRTAKPDPKIPCLCEETDREPGRLGRVWVDGGPDGGPAHIAFSTVTHM